MVPNLKILDGIGNTLTNRLFGGPQIHWEDHSPVQTCSVVHFQVTDTPCLEYMPPHSPVVVMLGVISSSQHSSTYPGDKLKHKVFLEIHFPTKAKR